MYSLAQSSKLDKKLSHLVLRFSFEYSAGVAIFEDGISEGGLICVSVVVTLVSFAGVKVGPMNRLDMFAE